MRNWTFLRFAALWLTIFLAGGILFGCASKDDGESFREARFAYTLNGGDPFQTNLNGNAKKFLQTKIVIEISNEKMLEVFTEKDYKVCDAVLLELRTLTEEQLKEADIQSVLGQSLINKINEAMDTDTVKNVYFKSFVVA